MVKLPDNIIDFHVHLFPDRLFESIWQFFEKGYGRSVLHHLYYRQCVDYLRQRGIGTIVYSNYAHKEGVAEGINAWNLKVLDEIPDLYCFAAYHPGDADALEMADKLIKHPHIIGFKLQLLVQRFYPHDERLIPLYEMVQASNKRMLLHVGTGPVGNEFVALLKDSSLVSILAVSDLLRRGREYASQSFAYFETYTMVALVYLIITLFFSKLISIMEERIGAE